MSEESQSASKEVKKNDWNSNNKKRVPKEVLACDKKNDEWVDASR